MPHSIFLSHQSEDKHFARKLAAALQRNNIKVWIDEAEIKVGDSLIEKIQQGIQNIDYVGIILSPNSVNSSWVQTELRFALTREISEKKVVVLPIYYQNCTIPPFLQDKLYADFRTDAQFDRGVNSLLSRLDPAYLPANGPAIPSNTIDITFEKLESFVHGYPKSYLIPRYQRPMNAGYTTVICINCIFSLSRYLFYNYSRQDEVSTIFKSNKLVNEAVIKFYDTGYFNDNTKYILSRYLTTLRDFAGLLDRVIAGADTLDWIEYYQNWRSLIGDFANDFETHFSISNATKITGDCSNQLVDTKWIFQELSLTPKTEEVEMMKNQLGQTYVSPFSGINITYRKTLPVVVFYKNNTFRSLAPDGAPYGEWLLHKNHIQLILRNHETGYGWLSRRNFEMNVLFYGKPGSLHATKIFHLMQLHEFSQIPWEE